MHRMTTVASGGANALYSLPAGVPILSEALGTAIDVLLYIFFVFVLRACSSASFEARFEIYLCEYTGRHSRLRLFGTKNDFVSD